MTWKEKTAEFNALSINDRIKYLDSLCEADRAKFIEGIRTQAVKDFWTHEQSLLREGKSTRNWTPEQIEQIMNISDKTGISSINGDKAIDLNGKSYFGHHMLNVAEHPEYAGDWRNIEALDYDEHYNGAHNGNTKTPTESYYDPVHNENIEIDKSMFETGADVKTGDGYIPVDKSIFKSDDEIKAIYPDFGDMSDGESLAHNHPSLANASLPA